MSHTIINGSGNTFTHNRTHTSTDKLEVHTGNHGIMAVYRTNANRNCVGVFRAFPRIFQTIGIGLQILEMQSILGFYFLTNYLVRALIKKDGKVLF